jgi:calcium-activated chloride channel regulator 4
VGARDGSLLLAADPHAGADVDDALATVERVDVCFFASLSNVSCGAPGYTIEGSSLVPDLVGDATPGEPAVHKLPLPWDAPLLGETGVFLRVVGTDGVERDDWPALIDEGGACHAWTTRAESDHFVLVGVDPTGSSTWNDPAFAGGTFDVCADGMKKVVTGSMCIDQTYAGQSALAVDIMEAIDAGSRERLQAQLAPLEVYSWANGNTGAPHPVGQAGLLPMYVLLGPLDGGARSPGGAIYRNVAGLESLDPTATLSSITTTERQRYGELLRHLSHEHFHKLQQAWVRELPIEGGIDNHAMIVEGLPAALSLGQCSEGLLGAAPKQCVSGWKLGVVFEGHANAASLVLPAPSQNLFARGDGYAASSFWLYVFEQFSYPPGLTPAHPSGELSNFLRPGLVPLANAARAESDSGHDLVGLLYGRLAEVEPGTTLVDALDLELRESVGRGLRELVFDYRTTLFLKGYNDSGHRFRLDWVGAFNDASPLDAQRPFPVLAGLSAEPDGLPRAVRALDPHQTCVYDPSSPMPLCTAHAAPDELALGETTLLGPVDLEPFGAAAFSVVPSADYAATQTPVRLRMLVPQGARPRARVFRIERQGAKLVPSSVCSASPGELCTWSQASDQRDVLDVEVPVSASTEEVLLIAGADDEPVRLEGVIGAGHTVVDLIEPATSVPAFAGHPSSPDGKRPVLLKLRVTDDDLAPVDFSLLVLAVSAGGTPLCTMSNATDVFTVTPLSGGVSFALLTLDDACYPPGDAMLDLELRAYDASWTLLAADLEVSALEASTTPAFQSTVLAIDASGSMNDAGGTKLEASKLVQKALFDSLLPLGPTPTDELGLVSFHDTAYTVLPITPVTAFAKELAYPAIDGVVAGGWTSIGNGLLNAQWLLAKKYDAAPSRPAREAVVVLSDGVNTHPNSPEDYLRDAPLPVVQPNWVDFEGVLARPHRVAPLVAPRISSIAIGADADTFSMSLLAEQGGGSFVYLPETPSLTTMSLELADGFTQSLADLSDLDRVAARKTKGTTASLLPPVRVEPGATELRVMVLSPTERTTSVSLRSPLGALVPPVSSRPETTVWRVRAPTPGTWVFVGGGDPTPNESVLTVANVRSRVKVLATVDLEHPTSLEPPFELDDGFWVGSDLVLHVMPHEGKPVRGCTVTARVEQPSHAAHLVPLHDDGEHADGRADDGVYGARFTKTGLAGSYSVTFVTACTSAVSGQPFVREARRSVTLRALADRDRDRLPDAWEQRFGLDPEDPADAAQDPDRDGASTLTEFLNGTDPLRGDSDGSGEDDGSELALGRDPRDPTDDAVGRPLPSLRPGDEQVRIALGLHSSGIELELERALAPEGPWQPLAALVGQGEEHVDAGLVNGVERCYRLRSTLATGARSGFSAPLCATPSWGGRAARAGLLETSSDVALGQATFSLLLHDPHDGDLEPEPLARRARAADVRLSFDPSFAGVTWTPIDQVVAATDGATAAQAEWTGAELVVTLPVGLERATAWLHVRDTAGNTSPPAAAVVWLGGGP